jgi:succinate dehydrogenase / fumarate reductase cytochrome b subunit
VIADRPVNERSSVGSSGADPAGPWSSRWHRATGLVLVGYLLYHLLQLAFLRRNPSMFDRMTEWTASVGARLLVALVLVALVHHALGGLRIVLLEMSGASARLAGWTETVVVFVTAASVLPFVALLWRPYLSGSWL